MRGFGTTNMVRSGIVSHMSDLHHVWLTALRGRIMLSRVCMSSMTIVVVAFLSETYHIAVARTFKVLTRRAEFCLSYSTTCSSTSHHMHLVLPCTRILKCLLRISRHRHPSANSTAATTAVLYSTPVIKFRLTLLRVLEVGVHLRIRCFTGARVHEG